MKEIVYISGHLKNTDRGKPVVERLNTILGENLKEIQEPLHSKNEWCRDYMPVKASDGSYVLFKYLPSYIVGRKTLELTIPDQLQICKELNIPVKEDKVQEIIMDGGAIEIFDKKGIISSRVFEDNHVIWNKGTPEIYNQIKELLKLEDLIVIPADPWDFTGHVDGMIRFINKDKVLVNDLSGMDKVIKKNTEKEQEVYNLWKKNFFKTLEISGLIPEPLQCLAHQNKKDESAVGVYMNFLHLKNMILMPAFYDAKKLNFKAKDQLEDAYNKKVHLIEATELAKHGGIINCVTWQM